MFQKNSKNKTQIKSKIKKSKLKIKNIFVNQKYKNLKWAFAKNANKQSNSLLRMLSRFAQIAEKQSLFPTCKLKILKVENFE